MIRQFSRFWSGICKYERVACVWAPVGQRAGLASWVGTQMDPFQAVQYSKLFYAINWQTRRKAFNRETAFIKYGSHPSLCQPPPAPPPPALSILSLFYHTLMPSFFFLLSLAEFYCVMYLTISHNFFVRAASHFFSRSTSFYPVHCFSLYVMLFWCSLFSFVDSSFFLSLLLTITKLVTPSFLFLPLRFSINTNPI